MRHGARLILAVLFTLPSVAAAAGVPSAAELERLFGDKQYRQLLPDLTQALAVRGRAAAAYDRFRLLQMRGEASLQVRARAAAIDAFGQAAKIAPSPAEAALATATAVLVRASSADLTYVPRTGTPRGERPQPIEILTPGDRKSAFAALESDQLARVRPRVQAAQGGTSVTQILSAARSVSDLRPVELAADGGDGDVSQLLGDLGGRAAQLLDADVQQLTDAVNADVLALNARIEKRQSSSQFRPALVKLERDAAQADAEATRDRDAARQLSPVFGTVTDFKPTEQHADALQRHVADLRRDLAGTPAAGRPN